MNKNMHVIRVYNKNNKIVAYVSDSMEHSIKFNFDLRELRLLIYPEFLSTVKKYKSNRKVKTYRDVIRLNKINGQSCAVEFVPLEYMEKEIEEYKIHLNSGVTTQCLI